MKKYKHIIVGTGQAAGTLLGKLVPTGDTIAVIEGHKVGGSCVNYGCTPTKTLVASAKAFYQAKRGDFYGFQAGKPALDFDRVMERMNDVRQESNDGLTSWMESSENVDLIRGWGSFIDNQTLLVNDMQISAPNIYLNVGTRASKPPLKGLEGIAWLDSERLLALKELPEHLIMIGGGYIGVEFAQVFRRFGSKVTLIQRGGQLMPQEDKDIAEAIADILTDEGIDLRLNTEAKEVQDRGGKIELTVAADGHESRISGSHLLVATGRRPNTEKLNLAATGIQSSNRGYIEVDDHCQTRVKGVFALGDVNGKGAFTHTAVNDAEIVLDYLEGGNRKLADRIPIYALFTDPPLGRVGLSEKQALEKGHRVMKGTKSMSEISRAKEMGNTKGFAKLLVDGDSDQILGAAILGPGGDEIVNMFAAIMHSKIPCKNYRQVVLVHPTVSELMPFVLDGLAPA